MGFDATAKAPKVEFLIGTVNAVFIKAEADQQGVDSQLRLDVADGGDAPARTDDRRRRFIGLGKPSRGGGEPRAVRGDHDRGIHAVTDEIHGEALR